MHVAHLMIGQLPFPNDWANAAATAVAVSKIGTGPSRQAEVVSRRSLKLRPSRLFWRINDRLEGVILSSAVTEVARQRGRVDVLHGHFASSARPLVHAARRHSAALVVTEHFTGATSRAAPSKRLEEAGWSRARDLYKAADRVIAVSTFLADAIAERTGVQPLVVGNPIDVELFSLGRVPEGAPIAVFVGRLDQDKRPQLLIEALSHNSCPADVRAVIIGDGPDREAAQRLAHRLGVAKRVTLTGRLPRSEVAAWVRRATIGVSTSFVETFGVAVAEMAAAGVPVVAPDLRPFDEVLPESGRVLFEDGSVASLAEAIATACQSKWNRAAIRRSICDRFSPSAVGDQLRQIYTSI